MDELAGIPLNILGVTSGWAAAALFVVMFMRAFYRGDIVSRRTHEDVMHDRDEWRAAHRISESARSEGEVQIKHMAETATTMNQLLRELQERLRLGRARSTTDSGGSRNEQEDLL